MNAWVGRALWLLPSCTLMYKLTVHVYVSCLQVVDLNKSCCVTCEICCQWGEKMVKLKYLLWIVVGPMLGIKMVGFRDV